MSDIYLCRLDELADPGSRGVQLPLPDGTDLPCVVVRYGSRAVAYRNACPHTGAPLEWRAHQFLDADGRLIQCALHGALFRPEDGRCVQGPCAGDALRPVTLEVRDGWVSWRITADATA
jgi:nitrite reductase/ring-hydroxylating ferredoxin subunit